MCHAAQSEGIQGCTCWRKASYHDLQSLLVQTCLSQARPGNIVSANRPRRYQLSTQKHIPQQERQWITRTYLSVQPKPRSIQSRGEHSTRAPAELVTERTKGNVGRRKAATERSEGENLFVFGVELVDEGDGGAVVDAGVQPDLVE